MSVLCLYLIIDKFIGTIFLDSIYKQYHIIFVLCLTSLSMTISGSIHAIANGMISFFYMAKKYSPHADSGCC